VTGHHGAQSSQQQCSKNLLTKDHAIKDQTCKQLAHDYECGLEWDWQQSTGATVVALLPAAAALHAWLGDPLSA
jgi:hypothetical protein